jgi:hypothetical protein
MFVVASERKDAWPDDHKERQSAFFPSMAHSGQARAALRAEHDPDSAATAIVDDRIVAPVHVRDEHIGTVQPIGVDGINPV